MSQVRNLTAFIKSYLGSDSGKAALNRKPFTIRDKTTGAHKAIWRSPSMALAFKDAVA